MRHRLLILFFRLLVLVAAICLAYFTTFTLFPYLDQATPALIAFLLCYCFLAYIGLPGLVHFWQFLHKPTRLPTRTHARDGWALDPINIAVAAKNEDEFIKAMTKSGWLLADAPTFKNRLHFLYSLIFNLPYPTAPFGTHYVFGRRQDLGFQIPIGNSVRNRHHVRFWKLGSANYDSAHEHVGFWRSLLEKFLHGSEREIWVGAAVTDLGLTVKTRTLQLDHGIDSNTMNERDFVVESLKNSGALKNVTDIKAGEPLRTRHQGFRETIIADGYLKMCELKKQI